MTSSSTAISKVALVNPPPSATPAPHEEVAFVGMAEVDPLAAIARNAVVRPYGDVAKGYTPFEDGDILVAKITPCFENMKIGQARTTTRLACGSTEFHVLRPRDEVLDRRYLLHFLRQRWVLQLGERRMTGSAGQRRVPQRFFDELEVPLPPIEEQRRIAAVLDAADALRAKRRHALATLDSLTQSIFVDLFGPGGRSPVYPGPVKAAHPRGWMWVPITDVASIGTGHTPDRSIPAYWDGDLSWINLTEIRALDGKWCTETGLKVTPDGVSNSSAVVHPAGTVCFSRTASIGFVTVMAEPMTTSQDFVTWTCDDELRPEYLMQALLMSRETLRASASGSTHKTIYVRDAERFTVLLPPRDLQDRFSDRMRQVRRETDRAASGEAVLDSLFASLQQRAFGEGL